MNGEINKQALIGFCYAFFALILLSSRSILVKYAYQENILIMDLFYLRFLFALPMLLIFAYYNNKGIFLAKIFDIDILKLTITAGIFGYYLATLLDFHALSLIDANISRVILYIFPIFVIIINSCITKKMPTYKNIVIFFVAFFAVFLTLGGLDINTVSFNIKGGVLSLLAAISYAVYVIINNKTSNRIGSSLFTFMAVFFSFVFISLHYFVFTQEKAIASISSQGWLIVVSMSLFCTFLPLILISESIIRIGLMNFSLFSNMGPVLAVIMSYIFLGEVISFQQAIGVFSVILILFVATKRKEQSR